MIDSEFKNICFSYFQLTKPDALSRGVNLPRWPVGKVFHVGALPIINIFNIP